MARKLVRLSATSDQNRKKNQVVNKNDSGVFCKTKNAISLLQCHV